MREIKSLAHASVKNWRLLRESKSVRKSSKSIVLFGEDAVLELGEGLKVTAFFSTRKDDLNLDKETQEPLFPHLSGEARFHITGPIWRKISGLNSNEGMGIEVSFDMPAFQEALIEKKEGHANKLLVIDGISDPGNVGALIRSAAAFGFCSIFFTSGSADPFNDKALRASKGLALKLELIEGTVEQCLELLAKRKYFIMAADAKGEALMPGMKKFQANDTKALALVVGNEARGVNPALLEKSFQVAIPMEKGVESLNAAVAGSLLMWAVMGEKA